MSDKRRNENDSNDEHGDHQVDVRRAGQALRRQREALGLTQRDVERLSGGRLFAQQISRLETGALSKPPMEDLVLLGQLYGLGPSAVARLYGYYAAALADDTRQTSHGIASPAASASIDQAGGPGEAQGERATTDLYALQPEHVPDRRIQRERPPRVAGGQLTVSEALDIERRWREEAAGFPARLQYLEALEAQLPPHQRLKLYHWLDLIITLLSDELRASSAPEE